MAHVAEQEVRVDDYRRIRERTKSLFAIARDEAYFVRPIALRNPIVFYEGHLPAFGVNTLLKLARGERGVDADFEQLFERGIDPPDVAHVDESASWPARAAVLAYVAEAERRIEEALANPSGAPLEAQAVSTIFEHEVMHQETFVYMLHNLPYEMKVEEPANTWRLASARGSAGPKPGATFARIPSGWATLGGEPGSFGWDNEFPQHRVFVDALEISAFNVTNGQYLEFMKATGARPPHFWSGESFRGMFALTPLVMDAPVWVTHDEATAYARWRGMRLPTEGEYHRAWGEGRYPWGDEAPAARHGNFDFRSWDPLPVGSHPDGVSRWGVHDLVGDGWEWTSTPFGPFDGFQPMRTYPQYSADFFDGRHFVMKGASPSTGRELIRRSFRNWFRSNYPYVPGKFRLVSGARHASNE